jgi:hypothetical protein
MLSIWLWNHARYIFCVYRRLVYLKNRIKAFTELMDSPVHSHRLGSIIYCHQVFKLSNCTSKINYLSQLTKYAFTSLLAPTLPLGRSPETGRVDGATSTPGIPIVNLGRHPRRPASCGSTAEPLASRLHEIGVDTRASPEDHVWIVTGLDFGEFRVIYAPEGAFPVIFTKVGLS